MRTPALALSWQLWYRHRRGIAAAVAGWAVCAALVVVLPRAGIDPEPLAGLAAIFLPATLLHLLIVFAYGHDSLPIEARQSSFPARQFTLPVRTRDLVGWPMLYGGAAVALAYLAWVGCVIRPCGPELPLVWPPLFLAALLAWLQALLWSPFGLPLARVPVTLAAAAALVVIGVGGSTFGVPEPVLAATYLVLLPVAYVVALAGVSRARRGDVPDWRWWTATARAAPAAAPRRPPFSSAARAQLWYEWRLHGLGFPFLLLCFLLPLTGLAIFNARYGETLASADISPYLLRFTHETRILIVVFQPLVVLPPFLAALLGPGLGALGPKFRASPFLRTRPLSSAGLVAAKLRLAALTAAAGLVVVALTALAWLLLTGTASDLVGWWQQVVEMYQPARACALVVLAMVGFVGLTWLLLCQGLAFGLTGRVGEPVIWVVAIVLVVALCFAVQWFAHHPVRVAALWTALPWLLAAAVLGKLLAATLALAGSLRRGLWEARPLTAVLAAWLLTAGSLLVLAAWLSPANGLGGSVTPLGIVLGVPLARILAAPLALEWGRRG
jgi:hypothetical protein